MVTHVGMIPVTALADRKERHCGGHVAGFAQPRIDQGTEAVDKNISDHLTSISRIEIEAAAWDILAGRQMEDARGRSSNGQPIGWCQDTKNAVGQVIIINEGTIWLCLTLPVGRRVFNMGGRFGPFSFLFRPVLSHLRR